MFGHQEDTGSHYFAAGRFLLCLFSRKGIKEREKRKLIDVTEKAFLEQDYRFFLEFLEGGRKKKRGGGRKLFYYASAFAAAACLIMQGGSYKKEIENLKAPRKTVKTVKKPEKPEKPRQSQEREKKENLAATPDEAFGDVAEACLFTLKEPDLALRYLERAPKSEKTEDLKMLCQDMMGEKTLSDEEFQKIVERRSASLAEKNAPLDGVFEICLRRDTKGSLKAVKRLGEKVLENKDSEMEKEKIQRYIAEAEK